MVVCYLVGKYQTQRSWCNWLHTTIKQLSSLLYCCTVMQLPTAVLHHAQLLWIVLYVAGFICENMSCFISRLNAARDDVLPATWWVELIGYTLLCTVLHCIQLIAFNFAVQGSFPTEFKIAGSHMCCCYIVICVIKYKGFRRHLCVHLHFHTVVGV